MKVNIIPAPKYILQSEISGSIVLKPVLYLPQEWKRAGDAFSRYVSKLGIDLRVNIAEGGCCSGSACVPDCCGGRVICAYVKDDIKYRGGYELSIDPSGALIAASDVSGFNHALATLFQLIRKDGNTQCPGVVLPALEISDGPDCTYRGMMVDLARYWHPFEFLLSYVDMCWYYKLSALQLHFTDDQSYTLPGKLYPRLSTSGRSYSFEEIRRLNEYANDRGIEIIPEIDVPGHNTGFAVGYPELFGTNGIICQHEDSIKAVADIFKEICDLFPYSKHIHIGGDEANLKRWLDCPRCMEYAKSIGIDTDRPGDEICDRLYVNFIVRMAEAVKEKGRIPIVWEGFPKKMNDLVPKDIVVMSWENYYQITPDLLEGGFEIINCSWNPMYIVAPDVKWTPEEIAQWSIFTWKPVHPGSPFIGKSYTSEPSGQVLGGQLLAWGDRVISMFAGNENKGALVEMDLLLERIPYLAQNTWNKDGGLVYNELKGAVSEAAGLIASVTHANVSGLTYVQDDK